MIISLEILQLPLTMARALHNTQQFVQCSVTSSKVILNAQSEVFMDYSNSEWNLSLVLRLLFAAMVLK